MSIRVQLTPEELAFAKELGIARNDAAATRTHRAAVLSTDNAQGNHILGARGEAAFCKAAERAWDATINTYETVPDVGPFEIRTRSFVDGELIIRDRDGDNKVYFLVVAHRTLGDFEVIGFTVAKEAKQEKWLRDPGKRRPAYFMPQNALIPVSSAQDIRKVESIIKSKMSS